jgi:hypothetical protein
MSARKKKGRHREREIDRDITHTHTLSQNSMWRKIKKLILCKRV